MIIEKHADWAIDEVEKHPYGKISIEFTVCDGQITRVDASSTDTDKIPLQSKT